MDERYLAGIIYQISCDETDDLYVGSTIKTLENRMINHRSAYKRYLNGSRKGYCKSYELLQYPTAKINLLFNFPCNSKAELEREEGKIQRQTANCINRIIAGRTLKEYRQDNKEIIREYKKQWSEDNKEKIKEKKKQYRQDNRERFYEHFKEYNKQYYQDNREKLNEKQRLRYAKKKAAKIADN